MNAEITKTGDDPRFSLNDITAAEMDIIQSGLVEMQNNQLKGSEFRTDRQLCLNMYNTIDRTIIATKE
ncbi:MAG: hypothetical protein A2066_13005 [Bacteroidetes bacterium GWB2_41_8]|nr:MAG: hypothetical protein A2066_13005 [Bacteroidetes bacterium GWB2_41_8]